MTEAGTKELFVRILAPDGFVLNVANQIQEIELTDSDELSFESTFERDMLLNFTDFSCHQVRIFNIFFT